MLKKACVKPKSVPMTRPKPWLTSCGIHDELESWFGGCTCLPCSSGVGVPWCVVHDENIFPSVGFCECAIDVASWVVVDKGGLDERLTPAGIRPGPKLPRSSGLGHPELFSNTTHKASFSKGTMQFNLMFYMQEIFVSEV